MGTRAIFLVTGDHPYGETQPQTIRLYKHWGQPPYSLRVLRDAIKDAQKLLAHYRILRPEVAAIPALGFAGCLIAADVCWNGLQTSIDTDVETDDQETEAIYRGPLSPKHFGDQGDLEWVYVLDVNAHALRVYHCGYGPPAEHIANGLVHPTAYADELIPEAQGKQRKALASLVKSIEAQGWQVNPVESLREGQCLTKAAG